MVRLQSLDVCNVLGISSIASCGPSTSSIRTQQPQPRSSETNMSLWRQRSSHQLRAATSSGKSTAAVMVARAMSVKRVIVVA